MLGDRTEAAVQRIEAALARISRAAEAPPPSPSPMSANVLALVDKHETLRETVARALADLDEVIAELEG